MMDLDRQLRDYYDGIIAEAATASVSSREPHRRWWAIAGLAALVTLAIGVTTVLVTTSDDAAVTPSTVATSTTAAPSTTIEPTTTAATSTTSVSTTVTETTPPTTTAAFVVPEGDAFVFDQQLEAVLADLLVAAEELGWTPPISLDASIEPGHVLATLSSRPRSDWDDGPEPEGRIVFDTATVRVFPTVDEAVVATDVLMEELLDGIPRVVMQRTPFDLIEAGDESAASYFTLGSNGFAYLVVRDGAWVVSLEVSANWPASQEPGQALLDALASDESQAELESFLDTILRARGRGTDVDVSGLRVPFVPPNANTPTYEHGWTIAADSPDQLDPNQVEDVTYEDRGYSLAITPGESRCRFFETPFGAIEPQEDLQYLDDGSGTIMLSGRYGDGSVEELPQDDPQYQEALSGCRRFEPVGEVIDLVVDASPGPTIVTAPLGSERRWLPGEQPAANGEAYRIADDTWIVLEYERERAFDLDPSLLVTFGITDTATPEGVEITRWGAFITSDSIQFGVGAIGTRSAVEAAFGVDLSNVPNGVIEFSFGFEFSLEPEDGS